MFTEFACLFRSVEFGVFNFAYRVCHPSLLHTEFVAKFLATEFVTQVMHTEFCAYFVY